MTQATLGEPSDPSAPIVSYEADAQGLTIRLERGLLSVVPYTAKTVRVRYTLEEAFSAKPSLTVVAEPPEARAVRFRVEERESSLAISTDTLSIEIDRETAALTYRDAAGRLLTREPGSGGKTLEPIDVEISVFDPVTEVQSHVGADGLRVEATEARRVVDRQAFHARLEFEWLDDEGLYGLGSHEEGMFNLRGQRQYLYQQNMKASVPVLVSSRGYGVFVDSTSLLTFHDDADGSYIWSDVDDELDFYFTVGPEFDDIVREQRKLTGTVPMLPRWAFGYIQSKERYVSQAELLEVAHRYRELRLPLDCIVLDWQSWTGDLWGQKTLDPERFPDPSAMMEELHRIDVHLMVSIWPNMRPGGDDWAEFLESGHLLGNRATYDAFDREARAMYWSQAERGLFSHGIDAWWADATEPFEADWTGSVKPDPEERLRINTSEAKRYLDPEHINAYSLLHSEGIYTGQRGTGSDKRVVNLTRSAYAGQQRYGTVTWSGDVSATWETLRRQIAEGLGFCVTGNPYWTTDIGAFFVARRPDLWFWAGDFDDGVEDLGYRELFVRWFQYAAWLPMFRAHGTDTPREIWRFGEPGEPTYEALVGALELRYRLLPYIYSLAGWTTQHDYTMLRSLLFDFRDDPTVRDLGDQFMFGPAFLVCPVYEPMSHGPGSRELADVPQQRQVYLPAGSDWHDFWTDRRLAGGTWLDAEAPLDRIPVYVRAGSIVPMGPVRQHAGDLPEAPLEIHVYPGADAAFSLYEDEGDGYAYETGRFSTILFMWDDAARRLTVGARAGAFESMLKERELVLLLHADSSDTLGTEVPETGEQSLVKRVSYAGQELGIEW